MADWGVLAWVESRPEWQRRALSFLGGAIAALALPPFYAVPVLLICFPLLLLLTRASRNWARALAQGWWFGFGHFVVGFYWIGIAFVVNQDVESVGGPFAVGLLAGGMAFFPAFATLAFYLVRRGFAHLGRELNSLGMILLFALAWAGGEWLRGHLFTGFPWNLIGYVWGFWADPMQVISLVGIYGLGLLTLIMALAPAALFFEQRRAPRFFPAALAGVIFVALVAGGIARIPAGPAPETDIQLRLVQANIAQRDKWRHDKVSDNFVKYLDLSREPRRTPPDVIIWPETAVAYFLNREPSRRFLIADVVRHGGYVIAGAPRIQRASDGGVKLWNSLFAVNRYGEVVASYDKVHLVPFGEYLPFRPILEKLGLSQFVPSAIDFTPGAGFKTIHLPGLPPFSPLICYEIIFPGAVARDDDPPAWILNVTNDAWYGDSTGPYQHLVAARFRAAEEGIPVVRAAGTGISAVIDPYGRVIDSLALNDEGIIDSRLPETVEDRTLYARIGDWSFGGLAAIIAAFVLSSFCSPRRNGDHIL